MTHAYECNEHGKQAVKSGLTQTNVFFQRLKCKGIHSFACRSLSTDIPLRLFNLQKMNDDKICPIVVGGFHDGVAGASGANCERSVPPEHPDVTCFIPDFLLQFYPFVSCACLILTLNCEGLFDIIMCTRIEYW